MSSKNPRIIHAFENKSSARTNTFLYEQLSYSPIRYDYILYAVIILFELNQLYHPPDCSTNSFVLDRMSATESMEGARSVLGDLVFDDMAVIDNNTILNSKTISCDCKSLILRPKHAKLILPTQHMLKIQDELKQYQPSDRLFKGLIRGCFWLVDDMYKFEQIAFTKEITAQNISPSSNSELLAGLRYLACADCNLCPLGWFNPETKESFLHIWTQEE